MTEEQLATLRDPLALWAVLEGRRTARQERLVASAWCRQEWHLLIDPRSREAVEVIEEWIDQPENRRKLRHADRLALHAYKFTQGLGVSHWQAAQAVRILAALDDYNSPTDIARHAREAVSAEQFIEVMGVQAAIIRDVFWNPFRAKPGIDPTWLHWNDGIVLRLTQSIYEGRRLEDMGVLHDALIDAGCNSEDMLLHAREQGSIHARGCWLIDLLLKKE